MKTITMFTGLLAMAVSSGAAPLQPHHLSSRPLQSVPVSNSDRAFLTDAAANIILQRIAAERLIEFTQNTYFLEAARFTLKTINEIEADLGEMARARGIALPLAGSVDRPREFERFLNSRNGAFEREYQRYAARSLKRMGERFERAARDADDPEVRAFGLRHVRWMEVAHLETKGLITPALAGAPPPTRLVSGRAAEIFEPPTSVPLAAAESPAFHGGTQ